MIIDRHTTFAIIVEDREDNENDIDMTFCEWTDDM